MRKLSKLSIVIVGLLCFHACQNGTKKDEKATEQTQKSKERWGGYEKIEATEIQGNLTKQLSEDWMLVTAGTEKSYNTMTVSWGMFGELWSKPMSSVFIRDSRYTYKFMDTSAYYTLSFFDKKYHDALTICGTKSGRDGDKVKEAGLTPMPTPTGSMSFGEATMIIECRKLYSELLKKDRILDKEMYAKLYAEGEGGMHTVFYGEIVNVWVKSKK